MGNDGSSATGFSGILVDICIYDSLLSVVQIETIRVQSVSEPGTMTLALAGGAALLFLRRRPIR